MITTMKPSQKVENTRTEAKHGYVTLNSSETTGIVWSACIMHSHNNNHSHGPCCHNAFIQAEFTLTRSGKIYHPILRRQNDNCILDDISEDSEYDECFDDSTPIGYVTDSSLFSENVIEDDSENEYKNSKCASDMNASTPSTISSFYCH